MVGQAWSGRLFDIPFGNGFERGLDPVRRQSIAACQAAQAKYADALVAMPLRHLQDKGPDGIVEVKSSAFTRWARSPTPWQTRAEWLYEGERALLETGNAVGLIIENNRFEVVSIVWAQHWAVHLEETTGDAYYSLSMPQRFGAHDPALLVPARSVFHIRINADGKRDPLRGRSPLEWCAYAMATNSTLSQFLVAWLSNRSSPSYALATDSSLSKEQMNQLRASWDEQTKQMASGGVPVMSSGLKPIQLGPAPGDQLLIDTFSMTVEDIARAFGLPRSLLGVDETASNSSNLIREWISLSLGAHIELWEQALERAFGFASNEHVEFDPDALLRLDPQAEASRLKELVTGGIMEVDAARAAIGLPPVEGGFGKVPAMQQQMVGLDLLAEIHTATIASKVAPKPEPVAANDTQPQDPAPNKNLPAEVVALIARDAIKKAMQAG
jgi:HK97 family phage portal protein